MEVLYTILGILGLILLIWIERKTHLFRYLLELFMNS